MKETVRFTVRPRPRSLYRFDVLVFANERSMYRWARDMHGVRRTDYFSICIANEPGSFSLGELLFVRSSQRKITAETVAHECGHAGHTYVSRVMRRGSIVIGDRVVTRTEEAAATVSENIMAAIMRELRKRGLFAVLD